MFLQHNPLIKCCPCIPKRFIVMLFLMFSFILSFLFRLSLVLTIANYVRPDRKAPPLSQCCNSSNFKFEVEEQVFKYRWPSSGIGHSLAAYFYGVMLMVFISGLLADKFGGKILLIVGMSMSSVLTLLTPMSFRLGYQGVLSVRIPFGMFQALCTVSIHIMLIRWIPIEERGTWGTIVFLGVNIGGIVNSLMTPNLFRVFKDQFEYVYYIYGMTGFIWTILFVLFCANDPDHDRFLSQKEIDKLEKNMTHQRKARNWKAFFSYPWKKILTSIPVWACVIANTGFNWYIFGITSQLPIFLRVIFHLDITIIGYVIMAVYILEALLAFLASLLVDYIERNKKLSTTANRKLFFSLSVLFPSVSLLAPLLGCKTIIVTVFLASGIIFAGFCYPSLKLNFIDLAPRYAGVVAGICHSFAFLGGVLSNTMYGYIVPRNYLYEWQRHYILMAAVYVATSIPFLIWGSGKIQPWNYYEVNPEKEENQPTIK